MIEIDYQGHQLIVDGEYIKPEAEDYEYPGAPAEFHIHSVYYRDIDVTDLLISVWGLEELEELILDMNYAQY